MITFSGYMEISRPVGIASRSRDTSPPLVGLSTLIFLENFDYFDPPHQTRPSTTSFAITCRGEKREENSKVADSVGEEAGEGRSEDKEHLIMIMITM